MKKIILAGTVLAVGAYDVGYKSRDFVRDKIYSPFRSSISQKITQTRVYASFLKSAFIHDMHL